MKAVEKCASERFGDYKTINKSGSGIRVDLFRNKGESVPCAMWTVHRADVVYSDDFKKAYTNLEMTKEEFQRVIDTI